jgi:ferrochelatase
MSKKSIGILLVNTGTPDEPKPKAVRRYLAQFLSDADVIEFPRWLWLPLLHGIILRVRPRRSARLYQRVWDERGSPLLYHTHDLAAKLQDALQAELTETSAHIAVGMRYGNPSIKSALADLRYKGATHLFVLPLFPQYSNTTGGTIIKAVFAELENWRWLPSVQALSDYHEVDAYIHAVARNIKQHWAENPRAEKLLFSFHGIPQEYVAKGDPYQAQCLRSAELIAAKLGLEEGAWLATFQSRFGPQEWLQPYTDVTLEKLGGEKLASLDVVCPGFAVDCLETVDEIGHEGCEEFQGAGGGEFAYIPALNATDLHVGALRDIILENLKI